VIVDRIMARRRVIIGYNTDRRRFGRQRERTFTALFLGPIIVGISARKYR